MQTRYDVEHLAFSAIVQSVWEAPQESPAMTGRDLREGLGKLGNKVDDMLERRNVVIALVRGAGHRTTPAPTSRPKPPPCGSGLSR